MIEINKLFKIYFQGTHKEQIALNGVDLIIKTAGIHIIKGSSGSGKSTLLSIIGALNKPTSGEVKIAGENIAKLPDHFASQFRRDTIGFIFQQFHLLPQLTALENIILPLTNQKVSLTYAEQKGLDLIARLNLFAVTHRKASLLSGGEQQRVAIARALVNSPKIIIADEPTASLDSSNRLDLIHILNELKIEQKLILIATHDEQFINSLNATIYHIQDGKIVDVY